MINTKLAELYKSVEAVFYSWRSFKNAKPTVMKIRIFTDFEKFRNSGVGIPKRNSELEFRCRNKKKIAQIPIGIGIWGRFRFRTLC